MKRIVVTRSVDQKKIADPCWMTENFLERAIGLLGKSSLENGSGLLIDHCNSIHTFFMKFPIDVIYLDHSLKVVKVSRNIKPWRFDLPYLKAKSALELPAGGADGVNMGDTLCLS